MKINRTKIEWTDYTWNPITGCKMGCDYCYARKMFKRFKRSFEPTFHPERLGDPLKLKKSSKIMVCSVADFFGKWNDSMWRVPIEEVIAKCPQHIFQILTKQYKEIYPMPQNVWIGVTINYNLSAQEAVDYLKSGAGMNVKFISFEPLFDEITVNLNGIDWIIIGAQTNPTKVPKKEWVEKLIEQAREEGIPIFIKDNVNWDEKIQEFPSFVNPKRRKL